MSDNWREILRDVLVLLAALALGLTVSWMVVKMGSPAAPPGPQEPRAQVQG